LFSFCFFKVNLYLILSFIKIFINTNTIFIRPFRDIFYTVLIFLFLSNFLYGFEHGFWVFFITFTNLSAFYFLVLKINEKSAYWRNKIYDKLNISDKDLRVLKFFFIGVVENIYTKRKVFLYLYIPVFFLYVLYGFELYYLQEYVCCEAYVPELGELKQLLINLETGHSNLLHAGPGGESMHHFIEMYSKLEEVWSKIEETKHKIVMLKVRFAFDNSIFNQTIFSNKFRSFLEPIVNIFSTLLTFIKFK
jgi:hypothetical protein